MQTWIHGSIRGAATLRFGAASAAIAVILLGWLSAAQAAASLAGVKPPNVGPIAHPLLLPTGGKAFTVSPPDGLTQIEEAEWWVGYLVGGAQLCGSYRTAARVQSFMQRSPYFRQGLDHVRGFDSVSPCGKFETRLEEIFENKEVWTRHVNETYTWGY